MRVTQAPPETLVGRRLATLGWALYGQAGTMGPDIDAGNPAWLAEQDWVTLGDGMDTVAPARFVHRHAVPERIAFKVNTVLGLVDAVEAGIGIGPLPCYVADRRPGLVRLASPDPDLAGQLWLLTHPDLRRTPRVRAVLDHLGDAITAQRAELAG